MKKYLNYIIFGMILSYGLIGTVNAKKNNYFNCEYQSDDGKNSYRLTIGYDDNWFTKGWYAEGIITKLNGETVNQTENLKNFNSASNIWLTLSITNTCPKEMYLKGKKIYINSQNLKEYNTLKLINTIDQNITNYSNFTNSGYSCSYTFGTEKIKTKVSKDYHGAIYSLSGTIISEKECPSRAYMICKKNSKTNCYYSYDTSKPYVCNNSDVDCYKLPDNETDSTIEQIKEPDINTYSASYQEYYGGKLFFEIKYDKNNDELISQRIYITSGSDKEQDVGLASSNSVDGYKVGVIDKIVYSKVFPEKFYCGNINSSLVSLSSTAKIIKPTSNGITCSTDLSVFNGSNNLTTYNYWSGTNPSENNSNQNNIGQDFITNCSDIPETIALVKQIYNAVRFLVPMIVIGLSIVDFLKVLLNGEEKVYKTAWSKFVKRIVIGIMVLILPILLSFIINVSGVIQNNQNFFCIFS